jgi:membrane protease YdiL (CAAX protease family)
LAAWPLLFLPLLATVPFVVVGFNLSSDLVVPLIVVGTALIALNEEVFFRGVLLEMLRPLGWRRAITSTAALFGAAHALNLLSGANVPFTILQVLATTAGGVTLAAIRIRTGSLWPLIVVHALLDAVALSTLTGAGVEHPMLMPAVFLWGALNMALWPLGWRLLRGRTGVELTALYDGAPGVLPRTSR